MKLSELRFTPVQGYLPYALIPCGPKHHIDVRKEDDGTYSVYFEEGIALRHDSTTGEYFQFLDALSAQCVIYELLREYAGYSNITLEG